MKAIYLLDITFTNSFSYHLCLALLSTQSITFILPEISLIDSPSAFPRSLIPSFSNGPLFPPVLLLVDSEIFYGFLKSCHRFSEYHFCLLQSLPFVFSRICAISTYQIFSGRKQSYQPLAEPACLVTLFSVFQLKRREALFFINYL